MEAWNGFGFRAATFSFFLRSIIVHSSFMLCSENNPQKLASLATMTSLLVDEAYIVVGCTKATVNVYDMATLQLSAAFRGPLEEDEEGADNQISTASAVSSGKKGPSKSKPLALSFSQFVGAVERRGSYIFGLLDKCAYCE
jgi:hypothetical protein